MVQHLATEVQSETNALAGCAVQVLLRWALQQGCAVIPKSVHPDRITQASPQALLSWQLSDADMAALNSLEDGTKFCWDASKIV